MRRLAILGGGSWGTALALVLSPRFECIRLWVHSPALAEHMSQTRENDVYLPGFSLPANVQITSSLEGALLEAEVALGVMPSQHARAVYSEALPFLTPSMLFVSATKGLETGTLLRMSELLHAVLSARFTPRVAVLSGPGFAAEVAQGSPTAIVISSEDPELAAVLQSAFAGPAFRLYTNSDPTGVEVGAALKNVIAIGAGVCYGLGLGSNAMAALITRGLAEITRLAVAMGGRAQTLAGLAGLGDLVLTCTGKLSRNWQLGVALAQGRTLDEIAASTRMVAEGVNTTGAAVELARRHQV